MTKQEVATLLRERTGISQKQAMDAVEIFLESVKDALKNGEKVSLVGFGTFFLKAKGARNGRNPRTGEPIQIPPKAVVAFKAGKEFREQVDLPLQNGSNGKAPQGDGEARSSPPV